MSNIISFDAHQYEVDAVTVYQPDQAEVTRKVRVSLKSGTNAIEIKNLPSELHQSSIRVDGTGNAAIVDVIYQSCPPAKSDQIQEKIASLSEQKKKLTAEADILEAKDELINKYSATLSSNSVTTTQFESYLALFEEKRKEIYEAKLTLEKELDKVSQEIERSEEYWNIDRLGSKVTIIVSGERDGEAELTLTYLVSNASWTPQYDLRASIASDQTSSSKIKVIYRASIRQSTGEDWSNVALLLSTVSPQQGTTIPALQPDRIPRPPPDDIYIGRTMPMSMRISRPVADRPMSRSPSTLKSGMSDEAPMGRGRFGTSAFALVAQKGRPRGLPTSSAKNIKIGSDPDAELDTLSDPDAFGIAQDRFQDKGIVESLPLDHRPVVSRGPSDGGISATFSVPGLSSIPTSSDFTEQTHTVFITEMETDEVELEWVTVPKMETKAFLECKFKNKSEYVFLGGDANIFMNNNFMAKSDLTEVRPQEHFTCSFGADPSIRVTYNPQTRKIFTSSPSIVSKSLVLNSSKSKNTATKTYPVNITDKSSSLMRTIRFEQIINVKNNKKTRVERLIVRDQVPVSDDEEVKVRVLKPMELAAKEPFVDLGSLQINPRGTSSKGMNLKGSVSQKDKGKDKDKENEQTKEKGVVLAQDLIVSQSVAGVTVKPRWIPHIDISAPNSQNHEGTLSQSLSRDNSNNGAPTAEADGSESGLLEWVCSLDAGASAELVLSWEVIAPASMKWE